MLNIFPFEIYMLRRSVAAYELTATARPEPKPALLMATPKPRCNKIITPDESLDDEKIQAIADIMRGKKMTRAEIALRVMFSKSTVRVYTDAMVRLGLLKTCGKIGKSQLFKATSQQQVQP